MKLWWTAAALTGVAMAGALAFLPSGAAQQPAAPKVGDKIPEFSLPGSDGKIYHSKDLIGKRAFVIAWFPKAFTGG